MDIHKPKPVRSWREFLIELGTITLGVCIALAAEQGVERWREHRQYAENRRAVRAELGAAIANQYRREQFTPCLERRLDEITALLDQAETVKTIIAPHWIGSPTPFVIRITAEPNLNRSDLFPAAEQQIYGLEYAWLHGLLQLQVQEGLAWSHLQPLEGRTHLTPEMIAGMRYAVSEARMIQDRTRTILDWFHIFDRRFDLPKAIITGGLVINPKVWPVCLPMTTPREEGQHMTFDFLEKR